MTPKQGLLFSPCSPQVSYLKSLTPVSFHASHPLSGTCESFVYIECRGDISRGAFITTDCIINP